MHKSTHLPVVIIPNLNGGDALLDAVESLTKQTTPAHIIVVDNASTDDSLDKLEQIYPNVEIIKHTTNKGYAGGVNPGFKRAFELKATYAAPFNDDAIADEHWLVNLVAELQSHPNAGAAACKVLHADGARLDSTGDYFTNWGLPYPRGRNELDGREHDESRDIFGASGAASLYRVQALKEVGLLDEDFFAYYEDVDLSFRLQLAGWKVRYVPSARVYHRIGMTSARVKGFTTHQTMKNLPMLTLKNVPSSYLTSVRRRLNVALLLFFLRAVTRGQGIPALKGYLKYIALRSRKLKERNHIQSAKKVSDEYIWSMITHDLPPNATALRKLRAFGWKLKGKKT